MDEVQHSEEKSEIASKRQRDAHGRFLPSPNTNNSKTKSDPDSARTNPLTEFLHKETSVHKSQHDELIDIHVGNPLRKITELLEDIKRQKAFSFTLKGSLGVAGIAVVIGTFGIFGGSQILCDKGTQTKIGQVRELVYKENSDRTLLSYIPFVESLFPDRKVPRKILLTPDGKIIHIVLNNKTSIASILPTDAFFLTGSYDSCSDTLKIDQQTGIQQFVE